MPRNIGTVVSRNLASLIELQTVYGTQDLFDMLELLVVDNYNARIASEKP